MYQYRYHQHLDYLLIVLWHQYHQYQLIDLRPLYLTQPLDPQFGLQLGLQTLNLQSDPKISQSNPMSGLQSDPLSGQSSLKSGQSYPLFGLQSDPLSDPKPSHSYPLFGLQSDPMSGQSSLKSGQSGLQPSLQAMFLEYLALWEEFPHLHSKTILKLSI